MLDPSFESWRCVFAAIGGPLVIPPQQAFRERTGRGATVSSPLAVAGSGAATSRSVAGMPAGITRGAVTVTAAVGAQLVLMPVAVGLVQTHKYRKQVHERPSTAYRDVTFTSTDGLTLSGWYRPSRNGAAVLVLPGAGGIRNGSLRHARLLASHGYGVLVYDARGTGRSEGTPNGWGWSWDHDVAGALTYLRSRPDVDPQRIGGRRRRPWPTSWRALRAHRCCSSRASRYRGSASSMPATPAPAARRSSCGPATRRSHGGHRAGAR